MVGHKRLVAWQKADRLAWEVYVLSDKFPKQEIIGITSQLRRAVISVVLNIVEGYARESKKEFRHFLKISLGSLAEVGYILEFSFKRGYITKVQYNNASELKDECGRIIWSLMRSL